MVSIQGSSSDGIKNDKNKNEGKIRKSQILKLSIK